MTDALRNRPPHDLDAENALLGAMFILDDAIETAISVVTANDFYRPINQTLFEAITAVYQSGEQVDEITVADHLTRTGLTTDTNVVNLLELGASTPSVTNTESYARIVADHAQLRRLGTAGLEVHHLAWAAPTDVGAALDAAEQRITAATELRPRSTLTPVTAVLDNAIDRITAARTDGTVTGLPTGHADLDKLIDGLHPSRLVIVGARPAMGKTSFALGVAVNAAVNHNKPVLFVSLEMDEVELTQRALSSLGKVNTLRAGGLTPDDLARLDQAKAALATAPLWIDANPTATVLDIKAKARQVRRRTGDLGLIVVDYLQLMSGRHHAENRQVAVAEMSRQLKQLAGELQTPVIALSQLSRNLELRQDKRPMLADLRESGAIEQDADIVTFLYRDEVYHPDTADTGLGELIIAKNRHGRTATIKLAWLPHYTTYADLAHT